MSATLKPDPIYIVRERGYETGPGEVAYVGISWTALRLFVDSRGWDTAFGPAVEVWLPGGTSPVATIEPSKVVSYHFQDNAREVPDA